MIFILNCIIFIINQYLLLKINVKFIFKFLSYLMIFGLIDIKDYLEIFF